MKENSYDNELFFEKYKSMLRSEKGLSGAGEWPTLQKMLPDFKGKRLLDLGCGYGWHCMYAIEHGAEYALGLDLSEKMINEAKSRNFSDRIEYLISGIEDFEYPEGSFDIVLSSLALHYVENLGTIFANIYRTLKPGGSFIFTIEHPVFTAQGTQEWVYNDKGTPLYWPVDNYYIEGRRIASFLGLNIVKYHHTLTTIIQSLIGNGFIIENLIEPQPTKEMLETIPEMKDEMRRPMMLSISVKRSV